MFGKKKKRLVLTLSLFDENDGCVACLPLETFTPPRDIIVALSIEFFNDPEPCEIHSAAVRQRLYDELCVWGEDGQHIPVSALPENRRGCFEKGIHAFSIMKTEQ